MSRAAVAGVPPEQAELAGRLDDGLAQLELALPAAARAALLRYLALLAHWNRAVNLTAVRTPEEMVSRHLLESLALVAHLRGPRIADVGSGAGLPGIPLAIACPDFSFTLIEANARKSHFLTQVAAELDLGAVTVVRERVEHYHPEMPFDTVVARAFAPLSEMMAAAGHLCAPSGQVLYMAGAQPVREPPAGFRILASRPLEIPGVHARRALVTLQPTGVPE